MSFAPCASKIAPGTTLSLTDQEPQNPDPSQTK
jgi:hypothetical protein